jgi:hypothetical protein
LVHGLSAAHWALTVLVHEPPVPSAVARQLSQASPAAATVPSMQYSLAHALAHAPTQTQFWMIVT